MFQKVTLFCLSFLLSRHLLAYPNDQYLTHYWPITNSQMNDQIGSAHMTQGSFTTYFTMDRFGTLNAALDLNGGWTQVPSGIYFDTTEFTISVWVLPQQVDTYARIIDFGNGYSTNNVVFALSWSTTLGPYMYFDSTNFNPSTSTLTPGQWQFLVATFDGTYLKIYKNGQIILNFLHAYSFVKETRSICYVGKSHWYSFGNGYSSSVLDELRFYNKSLSQVDITDLMNRVDTSI